MTPAEYRQFLHDCLADYDQYVKDCVQLLSANPEEYIKTMTPQDKERYLLECRHKFIEACVTAYVEDTELEEQIDG